MRRLWLSGLVVVCLAPVGANPFSDVPGDHWAAPAIDELTKVGVVQGSPDGLYRGTKALSRYEFAVMAGRMLKIVAPPNRVTVDDPLPFADVPVDHWGKEAVAQLFKLGVIQGTPDALFHGDQPLVRYDYAVMAARLLALYLGQEALNVTEPNRPFADVAADHYAAAAVRALLHHGVLQGTPQDQFEGEKPLTRYDFAVASAKVVTLILATRPAQ